MIADRLEGKWIDLFAEVFSRCKVGPGDACAILSETQSRALNVQLAELALQRLGARPFQREDYVRKFKTLTADAVTPQERDRFLTAAQGLPGLKSTQIGELNVQVAPEHMPLRERDARGIF